MLELVITACLIGTHGECKQFKLDASFETASQCSSQGQFALAQWAGDNYGWQISRWECAGARKEIAGK